ncbi:MAG: gliding motility-associated C-terminal domain-containing protein [Bacteroidota bacterium]|nr:gliding motility-associated C-terminal domain-containing protein [Bacteroidota bacterium]
MKKITLAVFFLSISISSFALNITIIESTSFNTAHTMDATWNGVALGMGHTPSILPQTTLDNTTFFATTDILIISSGIGTLPSNRVATILAFLQTGKPVYIQSEYLSSYDCNQAFASIISSLGGTFTWTVTMAGDLSPMNVLGTFATTNNVVPSISYYWYSVPGNGDCNTLPFLEYGGANHGWQYVPSNPAYGNIITTTDQDWVNQSTSIPLMENIITHLITPGFSSSPSTGVDLGNDTTICQGQQLILDATSTNATYAWQNNSTNPTFTVTAPGTYFVTVTGSCGTSQDTIVVNFSPSPVLDIGNDTSLCVGDQLILDATTPGAAYLWSDNSTNATITVSATGMYWAQITVNGCSAGDSIQVNFNPAPVSNLGNDISLCAGQNGVLNGGSAAAYLWSTSATTQAITVNTSGTYWVQLSSGTCSSSDTINVTFLPLPNVNLGNDFALCIGQSSNLNAGSATNYLWSDGSTNVSINITLPGTYWVVATNNQCSDSDTIIVTSEDCDVVITLPNVFSPNSDGSNDIFIPVFIKGITTLQTSIYNRWGELIYVSNNLTVDWNGKVNGGNDASDGVYYWVINYTDLNGDVADSSGFVTLIR